MGKSAPAAPDYQSPTKQTASPVSSGGGLGVGQGMAPTPGVQGGMFARPQTASHVPRQMAMSRHIRRGNLY